MRAATELLQIARTIHAHAHTVNQTLEGMHPTICVPHPTDPQSMTILDLSDNPDMLCNLGDLLNMVHAHLNHMEWISMSLIIEPLTRCGNEELLMTTLQTKTGGCVNVLRYDVVSDTRRVAHNEGERLEIAGRVPVCTVSHASLLLSLFLDVTVFVFARDGNRVGTIPGPEKRRQRSDLEEN